MSHSIVLDIASRLDILVRRVQDVAIADLGNLKLATSSG